MRRLITSISMIVLAIVFYQCSSKSGKVSVDTNQQDTLQSFNDNIINMERLKEMGIDKKTLTKHMKLQELAWYGGDFRDDQSKPRYEPTELDFLLTIPFVDYYLSSHGYKRPTEKLFQDRIKKVFGIGLKKHSSKSYEEIVGDGSFDFAHSYYSICDKNFITYNWMLRDMLSIEGDKIKLKSEVFQQILALNKFLIYDDPSAFKILELSKYEGDENDLGDFYSGKMILDDLFSTYNYFGSSLLNQWYFNKQKDVPYGFVSRIFEQTSNKKLVVHPSLIETVERNSTGKNRTYFNNFGLYVYQMLQNEDGMNSNNYTLEEKARIFCHFANSEYKMRNKYAEYMDTGDWGRTSWTYIMMTNCKSIYEEAQAHKFFGISKPEMMEEMEQEGLELNPSNDNE